MIIVGCPTECASKAHTMNHDSVGHFLIGTHWIGNQEEEDKGGRVQLRIMSLGKYRDIPLDEEGQEEEEEEEEGIFVDEFPPKTTRRKNDYTSVRIDDDDDEEEDANNHHVRPPPPRRRCCGGSGSRPAPRKGSWSCSACLASCLCGCILSSILILGGLALGGGYLLYKYEQHLHPGLDWKDTLKVLIEPETTNNNDTTTTNNTFALKHETGSVKSLDEDTGTTNNNFDVIPNVKHKQPIVPSMNQAEVHYNPNASLHPYNPYGLTVTDETVPGVPQLPFRNDEPHNHDNHSHLGYLTQPNMVNNTLVFVAEGDLYLTKVSSKGMGAMKLTTTVGNVIKPVVNPRFPYLVAFTATYTGHRDVYLLDLRRLSQPSIRLTYTGAARQVVSWKPNGQSLLFAATNQQTGLPDVRLYELTLVSNDPTDNNNDGRRRRLSLEPQPPIPLHENHPLPSAQVLQVLPVPLSQAINGVWEEDDECLYFTRYTQSSRTVRYVGGTAPNLWVHCQNDNEAIPLTANYRGTSKDPSILRVGSKKYLLFLSDRDVGNTLEPSTMNLWAVRLPPRDSLNNPSKFHPQPITQVSCHENGMALMEYSVDPIKGSVALRIGAGLHLMSRTEVLSRLANSTLPASAGYAPLDIHVYSDFNELHERVLPNTFPKGMTSVDVYENAFGTVSALLGVRGQLFVAPVVSDPPTVSYQGAGMNMPPRRYRVGPGSMAGGLVRILTCKTVPMPQEESMSTRRLAVILATDPLSHTAEHAFYMVETQSDSAPSFVDPIELPTPFLGGHVNGGSVAEGGLGSVDPDTVTVSPCGRRLAWTDTDGRIAVMNLPMYQTDVVDDYHYTVLPPTNELDEAMVGIDAALSWSPGGRYLAVTHTAKNQFSVISLVDAGDPNADGTDQVSAIALGRIVQATPSRFNSRDATWGKTSLDFKLDKQSPALEKLLSTKDDDDNDDADGATVLYFLSDRDVQSDVRSPWGTRAPAPHLISKKWTVYALPLVKWGLWQDGPLSHGIFAGGGAAELWSNDVLAMKQTLKQQASSSMDAAPSGASASSHQESRRRLSTERDWRTEAMHYSARRQSQDSMASGRRLEETKTQQPLSSSRTPSSSSSHAPSKKTPKPTAVSLAPSPSTKSATPQGKGGTELPSSVPSTISSETPTGGPDSSQPSQSQSFEAESQMPSTGSKSDDGSDVTAGSEQPSDVPSAIPSQTPSYEAAAKETESPSTGEEEVLAPPSEEPSQFPSAAPTSSLEVEPSALPTATPITSAAPLFSSSEAPSSAPSDTPQLPSPFTKDYPIEAGTPGLAFAARAYRVAGIPAGNYIGILSQLRDDPSLVLIEDSDGDKPAVIKLFNTDDFPSDNIEATPIETSAKFMEGDVTTTGEFLYLVFEPNVMKVVPNTAGGIASLMADAKKLEEDIVDTQDLAVRVWPSLEYEQMYNDAWRMLRDYFYDVDMHGVDWKAIHARYHPLVKRCAKREDLDDVLAQMASELSALHVFVYGGEYNSPSRVLSALEEPASLGASLVRSMEWRGYVVEEISERDPDFDLVDGSAIYSPLSDQTLRLSGQRGLDVGDVIVGINGESVLRGPDIQMQLRGMAGKSVRLDVLRLASYISAANETETLRPEPMIVVPISVDDAANLRYSAWEYRTRQKATQLAQANGFSVGYLHLRSMSGPKDINAFFRGFFPNYNRAGLIIDVRHNRGGNIDSWLLDFLQRKAWTYWQGRATNIYNGGLGWDEHFAFRGHLVVLVDEKTSSDGEGFARGVSQLGLGKLVGTRTWGGGIWLSSDNRLVDGGIATAPEVGTYNNEFGWGMGIEQAGVEPDIVVDNNPRLFFDGHDQQLERAVEVLKDWLDQEPVAFPADPGPKKPMNLPKGAEHCPA